MPVVARDVDDRRDGNEWKFVTRSHASFRSGVVGNGRIYIYIVPSVTTRDFVSCCCVGIYLGTHPPPNFHFGGRMELGTEG